MTQNTQVLNEKASSGIRPLNSPAANITATETNEESQSGNIKLYPFEDISQDDISPFYIKGYN